MNKYEHKVHYYETDKMGITHHSNYIRWMEEARIDFLENIGWSYARLEELGVISPVTEIECKYKNTTTFSDRIIISVSIEEFNGVKLKIKYQMINADTEAVVCEGRSEHCFLSKDGKIVSIKKEYPEFYEKMVN